MPDGTGEEYGAPSLTQLKQMSWDIGYIRDKLTLGGVSKTMVWRRSNGESQMVVGRIAINRSNLLGALRALAQAIQDGEDGAAPPVSDFGQSGWTQTQLMAMYEGLAAISSRIMTSKRTFTMRMSGGAGSNVELTIGTAEASNASYRMSIAHIASQLESGLG